MSGEFISGARSFIPIHECMVCLKQVGKTNLSSYFVIETRFVFNFCRDSPKCERIAHLSKIRHLNNFGYVVEDPHRDSFIKKNQIVKIKRSNGDIQEAFFRNFIYSKRYNSILIRVIFNEIYTKSVLLKEFLELNPDFREKEIKIYQHPDSIPEFSEKVNNFLQS